MGGWGRMEYHVHFTSWAARDILIFWKRNNWSNKAFVDQYSAKHCIWIGQTKGKKSKRERKHDCFERNSRFWTAIHFTCSRRFLLTSLCNVPRNTRPGMGYNSQHFFSNFHVLKTWFELLRIKLYRNSLNPLSPSIHIQILQTDLHTSTLRISWENLIKDHGIFSMVIILLILITLSLDCVWILLGENWCWTLLGLKGLRETKITLS